MGEGGFIAHACGVLADGDQQLRRRERAHAQQRGGARCDRGDQCGQVGIEAGDLGVQRQDALTETAQDEFGRLEGQLQARLVSPQARAAGLVSVIGD